MEIPTRASPTPCPGPAVDGAPVFFERAITTEVVARSGESILLAGLISESQNENSSGVPGLSKIPGLGYLFRSDSKSKERTDLVVLITPRVIENPRQWNDIRIGMQGALENLVLPESTAAGVGRGEIATPVAPAGYAPVLPGSTQPVQPPQ